MAWKRRDRDEYLTPKHMIHPRIYLTKADLDTLKQIAAGERLPLSIVLGRLVSAALEYVTRPRKKL